MIEVLTNNNIKLKTWLNNVLESKEKIFNYTFISLEYFKLELSKNENDYIIKVLYFDLNKNDYVLKYQFITSDLNYFDWFINCNLIYLEA